MSTLALRVILLPYSLQKTIATKGLHQAAFFPTTTYVVQWRGSQVRKMGGKAFGFSRWGDMKYMGVTFKVCGLAYKIPRETRIAPGTLSDLTRHEVDSTL